MPLPTGYSAPIIRGYGQTPSNIPEGAGYDASGNPFMSAFGQQVSVPSANGFPLWNQAYNLYGNPAAAAARRNQIGQGGVGRSFVNPMSSFGGTSGGGSTPMSGASPVTFSGGSGGVGGSSGFGGTSALENQTTQRNLANGPSLSSLSDLINSINRNAQQQANSARVPGGPAVENTLMGNTASLARGQLPQDVIDQIQQRSAERGISTGNDNYLHSLGLNSLQAQQIAQGNLTSAYGRNPAAPIFDPTTQLLNPYQAGSLQNERDKIALGWYQAMRQGYGGSPRGGSGGGSGTYSSDPTGGTANWFQNLVGGTPSSGSVAPPSSGGGGLGSTSYANPAGSSYTGYNQDWSGLFGDPYANPVIDEGDASNPGYWKIPGTEDPYDPFDQYGG